MRTKTAAPITLAIAATLSLGALIPATSTAATLHFTGKATGVKPDANMTIAFDVVSRQGRPGTIKNIFVTDLDYRCEIGVKSTERDLRYYDSAAFSARNRFDISEVMLPPAYKNEIEGKFLYPRKGVRKRPTVQGTLYSEFGYGLTRDTYNCLGVEDFVATARR